MKAPHPYDLSKFFSALLGKEVTFGLAGTPAASKAALMLGEYRVEPHGGACVVSADMRMLALFAAALLGLPDDIAVQRALESPMDEPVRDAIHEVLNVAASGLATTDRLVFTGMQKDAVYLSSKASDTMSAPLQTSRYEVRMEKKEVGRLTIYSC